jgi:uncharacterized SAM-binding protein YcdF (DUF218 family)
MRTACQAKREQGGAFVNLIVLLCLVVFCLLLYLVRHPLLRYAAESWVIDEPAARADAIIVLGDDNFYGDRASRAAELSRQEVAPVVVASGRWLRPKAGLAELMTHDLVERGVPENKVLRFDHNAHDTIDEAQDLAKLAEEKRWRSVIIVTSNYHTRRVRYIYRRVFPAVIAVSVASAKDGDFDAQSWWEKRKSVQLFAHEVFGMLYAIWELRGDSKQVGATVLFWLTTGLCRYLNVHSLLWKSSNLRFTYSKCCTMFNILSRQAPPA